MISADLILSQAHGEALARLRHISGFATTLTREGDERAFVFNRLAHVERVLLVSRMLCRLGRIDPAASDRAVVLHDLNRWVFAHNAENGLYSQEAELEGFLRRILPELPAEELGELRALHRRSLPEMRPAVRPALAADLLTGIVEDPILLYAGLNVHPNAVPGTLFELLFPGQVERGLRLLRELCALLNADRDPAAFSRALAELFTERAEGLLARFAEEADSFDELLERIAREYRRIRGGEAGALLRINNELICHGSRIHTLVGALVQRQGYRPACELLLELDEPGFVAHLREAGLSERELEPLYPELDCSSRPDSSLECLLRLP